MKVVYTDEALQNLDEILTFIAAKKGLDVARVSNPKSVTGGGGYHGQGVLSSLLSFRLERGSAARVRKARTSCDTGRGRPLPRARRRPANTYESGLKQRTVLIEFDSVAQAVAAHDSPAYQVALKALGNAAKRDVRIVEGIA